MNSGNLVLNDQYILTLFMLRGRGEIKPPPYPRFCWSLFHSCAHTQSLHTSHTNTLTHMRIYASMRTHTMSCIHALVTLLSLTQSILLCVLMVYLLLVLLLVDALQKLYVVSGVEFHHLLLLRLFGWNNTGTESKSKQCHEYAVQWPGTESVSE